MKHIGDICRTIGNRLGIDSFDVPTDGYNIDNFFDEQQKLDGVVCVAARSGVGKTNFVLDIALEKASRTDEKVVIVSCEKSAEQITSELIMMLCGLNTCFVNTEEKKTSLAKAFGFLSSQSIYIEAFEQIEYPTLSDVERLTESTDGIGLVVIDGLYCLCDEGKPEVAAINETRSSVKILKNISEKIDAPIIITTYFNRAEIKRMLSGDLSNNLLIESGVDKLMVLYRSVVGTTISSTTDFLIVNPDLSYKKKTIFYDTKNRRFHKPL